MGAIAIREKLQDYIRFADDKTVRAIYTIVEEKINQHTDFLENEDFLNMLDGRVKDLESGKVKALPWEEVRDSILNSKRK